MNSKQIFYWWIFIIAVIWSFILSWPRGSYLIGCDVGQGDALLITSGFNQVLIDGGPNNKVQQCLAENMPFWDRKIELVVNTHPDADHYKGLHQVVKNYRVEKFVTNNLLNSSEYFLEFRKTVLDQGIPIYLPRQGDLIEVGDLQFKVLWPEDQQNDYYAWDNDFVVDDNVLGAKKQGFNNQSIVLLFQKGGFNALLTGDIDMKIEELLIDEGLPDIELLKVAHHGSKYSTSEKLLDQVKPEVAVICVGENAWGHPTKEVLKKLVKKDVEILRTDVDMVKIRL